MREFAVFLAICATCALLSVNALAFGGDVDYAGGDDYGGGDYGGGYYDSDDGYSDGGGNSENGGFFAVIIIAGIFIFTDVFKKNQKKSGAGMAGAKPFVIPPKADDEGSFVTLLESDADFDFPATREMVAQWVEQFEEAWCDRDMSPCRDFITPELFRSYQQQLEQLKKDGHLPRTRSLDVGECYIERYSTDSANEYLDCWIEEQKITYIVSDEDHDRLIKGNRSTVYQLWYRWQLQRPLSRSEGWKLHRVDKLAQRNR